MGLHTYHRIVYGFQLTSEELDVALAGLYPSWAPEDRHDAFYEGMEFDTLFKGLPDHMPLTLASLEEYETGRNPDYVVGINLEEVPGKQLYSDAFEAEYKSVFEAVVAPALYSAGAPPDAPVELFEYTQLS